MAEPKETVHGGDIYRNPSVTDYSARMVRYGMISREEAFDMVKKHDHALDPLSVRDFCAFLGYSEFEFWEIIDKLYNEDIFELNKLNKWQLKYDFDKR